MITKLQSILIILGAIFYGQFSLAQGSDCATATVAVAGENIADGPSEGGGASNVCDVAAANADWYTYTPDGNFAVTLFSCLQGVDTRVSVMEGSCGALTCLATNDDACEITPEGSNFASSLAFNAIEGNTYYIEWDDRWSPDGFVWTLEEQEIITEAPDCPTLLTPADGAVDVSINEGANNSVTFTWSLPETGAQVTDVNILFGVDPDNLFNLGALGLEETINLVNVNYSTTYYWQIVATNGFGESMNCPIFSFTTEGSVFDCPVLGLNIGDACNDADVTTFGDTVMDDCECIGTLIPVNIDCANAIVLEEGITLDAIVPTEGSMASGICLTDAFNSIWYSHTPASSGTCTVSSSIDLEQPDTRISIFTGTCDDLICYASDDDGGEGFTSLVTFDVIAGETYFIEWDDRWGNEEFDFELSCEVLMIGDQDEDGVLDPDDNCPITPNAEQADLDGDEIGDVCDDDIDGDGVLNSIDCAPMDATLFLGASCDDGDPATSNDMIDDNCNCVGDITPTSNVRLTFINVPNNQITLMNFGDADQDISDWRLCSNFNYSANLSGETIVFGDLLLSPNEQVTVQWNPTTGFRETGDDIGIYLPTGGFSDPNAMVDFMQYLSAGNGRESVAVAKGIWGTGDFVTGDSPFTFSGTGADTGVTFWAGFVEFDTDEDGISDLTDNCIETPNADQVDLDEDGQGDACDSDIDGDGVMNSDDCEPLDILIFPGSTCDDGDSNTVEDVLQEDCTCMGLPDVDVDLDGIIDAMDNCIDDPNADQADLDEDGMGDVCDSDIDGDGENNDVDCDPMDSEIFLGATCDDGDAGTINDEIQNDCSCMGMEDGDSDTDGILDSVDNCMDIPNNNQADMDGDGMGDVCDEDIDGDGENNDDDCDPMDADIFLGASCDDLDDTTFNDMIQENCTCAGDPNIDQAPNANCPDAIDISEGLVTGADIFGGEGASLNCFDDATNSIWYLYTVSEDGYATVTSSVDEDLPDTRLSVYTGVCDNLSCIGSSDDLSGTNFTSTVGFEVLTGQTYLIEWDDRWNDEAFDFAITVGETPVDSDSDGIFDNVDNCVDDANPLQEDLDSDGQGDVCDDDIDGDGEANELDCNPENPFVFLGAPCDDGDPNTSEDVIAEDCSCQGIVGIEDVEASFGGVVLYPSPAEDELFVKFSLTNSDQTIFNIFDVSGRLISSETASLLVGENIHTLNTSEMNQGLYFLKVTSGEDEVTKRFSIVK